MNIEPDDDEDIEGEIAISFSPRHDELDKLGITPEQFESALLVALEHFEALSSREDVNPDELSLEELPLDIGGTRYRLGDLADVEIDDSDDDGFDDEYEEDDEDQDEDIEA